MVAGNQPTSSGQVDADVSRLVLAVRDSLSDVQNYNAWLLAVGGQSFLTSMPNPYIAANAAIVISAIGNHADLAAKYQGGSGGITLPFNYMTNGQQLWGGK